MNVFEIYTPEIERQLDRKVKIVRSNRNDEYYERYDSIK